VVVEASQDQQDQQKMAMVQQQQNFTLTVGNFTELKETVAKGGGFVMY
jgi:hypothetical protein